MDTHTKQELTSLKNASGDYPCYGVRVNLTSKKIIKGLLKKYQIRPSKRLGQNFLIDKSVIKKIIKAANLQPKDVVLEIGPGIGSLTQGLAQKSKKVIAVEKDPKMCEILKETLKDFKNVRIIQGDILKENQELFLPTGDLPKGGIMNQEYKIVASLPYYIVSPTIRIFLESPNRPKEMILIVQKEVAQRICSKPPKMNLLAISVQFYSITKILHYISKNSFWPSPKVDGAIIQIAPRINTDNKQINTDLFFKIVKAGFSQPRKQLANNMANGLKLNKKQTNNWLLKNNIQPSQRAETLTIKDWINLTESIKIK